MKRVTLKDIAAELNVTIGTVSHALNDMNDISPATKERVKATAKRMGYIRDNLANSLRSGKTNTLAVIIPDISNPLISRQVLQIELEAQKRDYTTIIFNTNGDQELERQSILTAYQNRVDGILLCPVQKNEDTVRFLDSLSIPFVLIGRYFENYDTNYICADDLKSGLLAGNYLLDRGYRSTVYVGASKNLLGSKQRLEGLKKAFSERGIPFDDSYILETDPRGDEIEELVNRLEGMKYDSIVAFSDLIAFSIRYIYAKKHNSPMDTMILGFDAVQRYTMLPFSHVSVGMLDDGWAKGSLEMLLSAINGDIKAQNVHRLVDVGLFEFFM